MTKNPEAMFNMYCFNHVKMTLTLFLVLSISILNQTSFAQTQQELKCSTGSTTPTSVETLLNCAGAKEGYSLKITSYFNKKTPFDIPSDFIWSSTEKRNDGCIYFKSQTGPGAWIRKIEIASNNIYTLPLELCGLENPSSKTKYTDATNAFINAFKHLKTINRKSILSVPKGHFYVNPDFDSKKFLLVPSGVSVEGYTEASNGKLLTNLRWDNIEIPVFNFYKSNNSGMKNLNFVFDGYSPTARPKYDNMSIYFNQIGINTGHFDNPQALQTVIFTIDSNYLLFNNLNFFSSFISSNPALKNKRNFSFGIVSVGSNPVPSSEGQGFRALSKGNRFTNISIKDFIMGLLLSGQENAEISNVISSRRGDWNPGIVGSPPGHLIYVTCGNIHSKNFNISNIKELGEEAYIGHEALALGTLAYKCVDGGTVKNITSSHPTGILQSGLALKNVKLENLQWSFSGNICPSIKTCSTHPVIKIITSASKGKESYNLTLNKISLTAPNQTAKLQIGGLYEKVDPKGTRNMNKITIENFYIKTAQFKLKDDLDYYPIFDLQMKNSQMGLDGKVVYIPTIPEEKYLKYFDQPLKTIIPIKVRENSYNSNFKLLIKPYPGSADFRDPELSSSFGESTDEAPLSGINGSSGSHIKVSF